MKILNLTLNLTISLCLLFSIPEISKMSPKIFSGDAKSAFQWFFWLVMSQETYYLHSCSQKGELVLKVFKFIAARDALTLTSCKPPWRPSYQVPGCPQWHKCPSSYWSQWRQHVWAAQLQLSSGLLEQQSSEKQLMPGSLEELLGLCFFSWKEAFHALSFHFSWSWKKGWNLFQIVIHVSKWIPPPHPSCLWTQVLAEMPAWFFSVSPHTFALQRWLGKETWPHSGLFLENLWKTNQKTKYSSKSKLLSSLSETVKKEKTADSQLL